MAELPELKIIVPPKPNQEPVEPGAPTSEATPPVKKSKAGKIVAWTCGSCLGIVVIGILIILGLITNWNNSFNQEPPLTEQDKINQPLAQAYNEAFTAQQANLPDFTNWMGAQFSQGIPCASNVDICIMGNTGSTAATPSLLSLEDAPRICDEVLAVAKTLGADQDAALGETSYQALTAGAKDRCVATMKANSRTVGFGWWSPSYFMLGNTAEGTPFAIQLNMYRESHGSGNIAKNGEYISYVISTSSVFDSPQPLDDPVYKSNWKDGQTQAMAFLSTLAYVRRANYVAGSSDNPSPFSPETAAWAKEDFEKYFNVDAKFEYFKGSDGLVRWFHVKAKDGFDACVSTGTDKELVTQNEDSMASPLETGLTGLTMLGGEITGPIDQHSIGYFYRGSCHE